MTGGEDVMAEQVIDLEVERQGDAVLVHVSGEIDMYTTPMLVACIAEQLDTSPALLVLDLRGVAFLGSSGLAALVGASDGAGKLGVTLRLVTADHAVLRPLNVTGLTDRFEIHPDVETALRRG